MGVDWLTCDNEDCKYNFPDCGSFERCEGCGRHFCNEDCAGGKYTEEDDDGDTHLECQFCVGDNVSNNDLIEFLIKKLDCTKEEAVKMYLKEKNV